MKQSKYPAGWDEERVRRVLAHYEGQPEEEAVAEDEAAGDRRLAAQDQEAPGLKTPARETGFAICVCDEGAEDLDLRKVYRVLPDRAAAAEGYLRIVDESAEDYLYPAEYFVFVDLPREARRVLASVRGKARPRRTSSTPARAKSIRSRPLRSGGPCGPRGSRARGR